MSTTTITGLPDATTPLTGNERVPMDQAGTTKDATTQAIADLAGAAITAAIATHDDEADPHNGASPTFADLTLTGLLTAPHIHGSLAGDIYLHVKNASGGSLAANTAVYATGSVGDTDRIEVAACDPTDPARMPAIGLLTTTLANNGTGDAIILGELRPTNTSSYTLGDELYVGAGGALVNTIPASGTVQRVGSVARVQAETGTIVVGISAGMSRVGFTGAYDDLSGAPGGGGTGTVTSVALTAPTGFSVSGSPITESGTLALAYDAGYQGFTSAESSKLAGIAAGAEVNVNADWDATSGDAQILNKPTLGTAAAQDVGTDPGDVVQLDGSGRLPAVDASQLTNLPSAGGTPGGADTELQYNNGGSFAGLSTFTTDGTNLTALGRLIAAANGAASAPPVSLTGTWFTGGTSTTTKPQLLIEPAGTTSTAWDTNGTGLGVNGPSGFTGSLLDLQVNGTSKFKVLGNGYASGFNVSWPSAGGFSFSELAAGAYYPQLSLSSSGLKVTQYGRIGWTGSGVSSGGEDLALYRDAANTLAQRNATNAQTYRLYNTYTDASNYERGFLQWNSGVFEIGTEGAGTGSEQPVRITAATLNIPNLPEYADDSAAGTGGLVAGDVYKTSTGELRIKL